jgi:hypothetical protein
MTWDFGLETDKCVGDILTLGLNIFNFPRFGIKSTWNKEVNLTP